MRRVLRRIRRRPPGNVVRPRHRGDRAGRGRRTRLRAHADAQRRPGVLRHVGRGRARASRGDPGVKLITWNVNSVRQRLARLLAMLERHEPDVVCLQETKVEDAEFPMMEVSAAGYEVATLGQRAYNGVAILSRIGIDDVTTGFAGDPVPEQSRVVSAKAGDLDVVCVYVVNGKEVGDPAYETKLVWLEALRSWLGDTRDPARPLIVAGDFNIAPDDRDVWDAEVWAGKKPARETGGARGRAPVGWGLMGLRRAAAGGGAR